MPSPGGKPAPRPRAPAPKVQVPPVSIGRGPAPLPPRMQPPRPAPMPPRMQPPRPAPMPQPPMPAPMPDLPYGGPINMPGGPFTPRPDLGPGVGFGPGLPQPGMPTPGMGDGKSSTMPGMSPPGFQTTWQQAGYNSLEEMKAATDPNMGGAQKEMFGNPMPPSMYSQPQPNFANALGTQSPFLNTVQR